MNVHAKCGHVKGSTNVIKPQTQLNIILNTLESSVFSRVLKVKALCGFSCNISVSQCVHGLFPGHLDALASLHKVSLRISFGLIKSYQGLNKYIGYSLYNLHGLSAEVWSSPVRGLSLMIFFFQDFFCSQNVFDVFFRSTISVSWLPGGFKMMEPKRVVFECFRWVLLLIQNQQESFQTQWKWLQEDFLKDTGSV